MMNYLSSEERLLDNDVVLSTTASTGETTSRETRRGSSILGTIFLMVNTTLGAGLLNFPQAFDKAGGVAISLIAQLSFLVLITAALVILANSSDVTRTSSMQDTFAGLCGSKSLFLCGICVTIYSFGCCITFLIIIGDQFDRVFATFYGQDFCHQWYMSRPFVTSVFCAVFVLPLCFSKRLDMLSLASSVGCVTVVYVVWLIVYESFVESGQPARPMRMWPDHWSEALQIIPVICFGYQSHMTAIPMYACMKNRDLGKFVLCAVLSMAVCFIAYSIVGFFGYATFGTGKVPSDILQGYTDKSIVITIAIVAVAVKNFTAYPIILLVGRESLLGLFGVGLVDSAPIRVATTLAWFVVTLVVAILVPDISPVINLLGTLSAAFIFLFPGVCLLQSTLLKDPQLCLNKDKLLVVVATFITATGAFISGVIFVEALYDLKKETFEPPLVTGFRVNLQENLCV